MSFVDNCMIPIGADNPVGAEKFINDVYDPKVAGPAVRVDPYVSPVKGAGAVHEPKPAARTRSSTPTANAKIYEFRDLAEDEDDELDRAFAEATQL